MTGGRADLLVRGGTIVTPAGERRADIACRAGVIVEVGPDLGGETAVELDATGLHVLPGLVDPHVHLNEPGREDWEGFATGSRALAAGGVTTFCDMPLNSTPPTTGAAAFQRKVARATGTALVDFGLWGGLVPDNRRELPELAALGVVAFKAFMSASGVDDYPAVDDLALYEGLVAAAGTGVPVGVHAESDVMTGGLAARARAEGRCGARDYCRSRPIVAEVEAITRAACLAAEAGARLHVLHVSSPQGVDAARRWRGVGTDVTVETCPHYLTLTEDDVVRLGPVAKCAPPLRGAAEVEGLWQRLAEGVIDMVVSDHSPAPPALKAPPGDDFFAAWGGISGAQSTLPVLLTEGYWGRRVPLGRLVEVTATNPARRFGLFPRKGQIAVGADADLALVDLDREFRLEAADLWYRHPHSPYVGRTFRGAVVVTVSRGRVVYRTGRIEGLPDGRLLPRRGKELAHA
ncbi:MAG TPA: allantoinase AllB [Methylomirabilota bacterium]|nr:allantoinase AllB [Methylomirabilota bacterium]